MQLPNLQLKELPNLQLEELPDLTSMDKVNFHTDNMYVNPYITYAMDVDVNKLMYAFSEKPLTSLQQSIKDRQEYWFNRDDPTQVNSYADVIMRTATRLGDNLQGLSSWEGTFKSFLEDTSALIMKGTIKPLLAGDTGALINNAFINFGETVDLIDNIWKGFAIGSGLIDLEVTDTGIIKRDGVKFNWEKGKEGARAAVRDRVNYDFETGNRLVDLVLEMATPTNIALLIASMGTSALGKSAATKAATKTGTTASPRLVKAFSRVYTGDLNKAIAKMPFNLTASEIKALEEIAKHATNLKVLAGVNKFKNVVDVVDKLGPRIAVQGTIGIPWKVIKASSRATTYSVRYFANAIDAVQAGNANVGLISTLGEMPEYKAIIKTVTAAQELTGEQKTILMESDILGAAANKDTLKINKIIKKFTKQFNSKELIDQYVTNAFKKTGINMPLEQAQLMTKKFATEEMIGALHMFAQEASDGVYKTIDEYINLVRNLTELGSPSKGMTYLSDTVVEIEKRLSLGYADMLYEDIQKMTAEVLVIYKQTRANYKELELEKAQKIATMKASYEKNISAAEALGVSAARKTYTETSQELPKIRPYIRKLAKYNRTKRPEEIYNLKKEIKRLEELRVQRYVDWQKRKRAGSKKPYVYYTIDGMIADAQDKLSFYERLPKRLKELQQERDLLHIKNKDAKDTLLRFSAYEEHLARQQAELEKLIREPVTHLPIAVELQKKILNVRDKEIIEKYLDTLSEMEKQPLTKSKLKMITQTKEFIEGGLSKRLDQIKELNEAYDEIKHAVSYKELEGAYLQLEKDLLIHRANLLGRKDFKTGFEALSQRLYGKNILRVAENTIERVEKQLGPHRIDEYTEKVQSTFFDKNGVLKRKEYTTFLEELQETLDLITKEISEDLGEMRNTSLTFEGFTAETNDAVWKIQDTLETLILQNMYEEPTIDAALIREIYDEFHNIKHNVKRSIKSMKKELRGLTVDPNTEKEALSKIKAKAKFREGTNRMEVSFAVSSKEEAGLLRHYTEMFHLMDTADPSELPEYRAYLKGIAEFLPKEPEKFVEKDIADYLMQQQIFIELSEPLDNMVRVLNKLEDIEGALGVTANIEVGWTKEVLKSYHLQMNHALRNFYLLQTEELGALLDIVERGDLTAIPALEVIESISVTYGTDMLQPLKAAILSKDKALIQERYLKIFGEALDFNKYNPVELLEGIDTILDVKKAAETIMDTLEGMVSVRKFYGSIDHAISDGFDENVASHFLDAVQRMYDHPASLVSFTDMRNNPNAWAFEMNKIFNNIENQMRSSTLRYNVKAESWRTRLMMLADSNKISKEAMDEFYSVIGRDNAMTHTALGDSMSEYIINKYVLKSDLSTHKNFFIDLETNGLNLNSTILQTSVVHPETNVFKWFINTNTQEMLVEDDLYHLLFNDPKHLKPLDELKEAYVEIFHKGNLEPLKKHFFSDGNMDPRIEIVTANGEKELLSKTMEFLQSQKSPTKGSRYRLHNGLEFDIPLLNNRLNHHGLGQHRINRAYVVDTKIELEDMLGLKRLSLKEKQTIEDLVYGHVSKRKAELSSRGIKRGLGLEALDIDADLGKFLPTMDKKFSKAIETLQEVFDPNADKTVRGGIDIATGYFDDNTAPTIFEEVQKAFYNTYENLARLSELDKSLKEFQLVVNADDPSKGIRLLPDGWNELLPKSVSDDIMAIVSEGGKIPDALVANHVGVDMMAMNNVNGVYIPVLSVKKASFPNVVAEYFDLGDQLTTPAMMGKMTTMGENIQRTIRYIKDHSLVNNLEPEKLHELQDILVAELQKIAGQSYFDPVFGNLKHSDSTIRSFATTYELFKIFERVSGNMAKPVEVTFPGGRKWSYEFIQKLIDDGFGSELGLMLDSDKVFKTLLSEYGDTARLFTPEPKNSEVEKILKYFGAAAHKAIDSLQALEAMHDDIAYSRILRTSPIYRGITESFDAFHSVVDKVTELVEKDITKGVIKDFSGDVRSAVYAQLRPIVESYDAVISFNKLEQVLGYLPEDMASYMRHHAKGIIAFDNYNVLSESYFPYRGRATGKDFIGRDISQLWMDLIENKANYEALGISFQVTPTETILYFKEEALDKVKDIAYKPLVNDFNISEWIESILEGSLTGADEVGQYLKSDSVKSGLKDALEKMVDTRKQLVGLTNDASTSTLEILDDLEMEKILSNLATSLPDGMSIETMKHLGMFEGNFFNHSILGHIDTRRKFMPFSSFNPAKTMFNSTQMLENKLSTQVMYTQFMQIPEFKVSHLLNSGMKPKEMVDYLKKSPHLKVAFLQDKTKNGVKNFKLSEVKIKSVNDLKFAQRVGATIVDSTSYEKAYQVINNYKISNPVLRFLDKTLVAPFKMGVLLWNYGVVARNIVDTVGKNVQTTKDIGIIPIMFEMTKDYYKYQSLIQEIYEHAAKQDIGVDAAVNEIFGMMSKTNPKMTREAFDMILEFQMAGGEIGMAKAAMEYYGDTSAKLFRRAGGESSGLSEKEFNQLLNMPDDVAEQYLKKRFGKDTTKVRGIMDLKLDKLTYKRAYKMHDLYKGKDLTTNDFITYLKTGKLQPGYEKIFADLMKKTRGIKATDDMMTRAFRHPLLSQGLSWNMQSEEILRLSLFKFMRDSGYSNIETMGEMTRTHFNYSKKHISQIYLEMAMPFSTFRMRSIEYWAEQLTNSPGAVQFINKAFRAGTDFNNRDREDIMMRRSLQYQLHTGNLLLNEDTGLAAKINPTAIDMMTFFADPYAYIKGNVHSYVDYVWDYFVRGPLDYESEDDFHERKLREARGMIPILGPYINAGIRAYENDEKIIPNMLLTPLFNRTWTPAQGGAYSTWHEKKQYMPRNYKRYDYPQYGYGPRQRNFNYYRKTYPKMWYHFTPNMGPYFKKTYPKLRYGYKDWSGFSTFNRTYYGSLMKFSRGSVFPTKNYRSLNTAFSDMWRRSMTKKGNPKYKFLAFPTNKWTLQLKVNILRNITSYNRWQ